MDSKTFNEIRELVYAKSGITLGDNKVALVMARLSKRMRALGIADYDSYVAYLRKDETGDELINLLDVISTNVTHFFREDAHFRFLEEKIAEWVSRGQTRFRFWSAACSSGEEPYSMAMTLLETVGDKRLDMKILATDISTRILAKCKEGRYLADKTKGIPPQLRQRYFTQERDGKDLYYVAGKQLKDLVVVKRLNLSTPPFPMTGPMDMVLCRNVMIYFDSHVRQRLLDDICRLLKPGGFLLVGHAESLVGVTCNLKTIKPSIYMKK
ncbi:MAG: chemotaxis protein CheR [Candidatus Wallbacteria bacterium HGW-Wallbacteria-1]|uniref:protein-glutamate O-methyltransferase n=1 Tax=Candidatus Wallbacteria bacterium HGW-Wallbacteria-1 TaxID=2013854 RepID=A0A2N1PNN1_9BACT|nr:MAG: chemotaxis protein CheR [Candidatus Wallbacteria bacterium HGW-Wallbacteria-1]